MGTNPPPDVARVAVLRLGRLGDLVMTVPALQWLVAAGLDVALICAPRYAALMESLAPGVTALAPDDVGDESLSALLDLHRTPESSPLARRLTVAGPRIHLRKESLARRGLLLGWSGPARTWPQRHLEAAERLLVGLRVAAPGMPAPRPRAPLRAQGEVVGLAVGAGHETKRWPAEHFAAVASALRDAGREVVVLAAPDEAAWAYRAAPPGVEVRLPETPLALAEAMAGFGVIVGGDTGTTWLAAALGVRVVALFGPTPVRAGFFVWGEPSVALSTGERCAPCSMHGGPKCPRTHHRCMGELLPAQVLEAVGL